MMSAGSRVCAEDEAADEDAAGGGDDDPLALDTIADQEAEKRAERRGYGDQAGVAKACRHGDALPDEQLRDPVGEPVEADRLEHVEDAHQDDAPRTARPTDR